MRTDWFIIFGLICLICANMGSNLYKQGAEREKVFSALDLSDEGLTNKTNQFLMNYSDTNKTSMERGVSLFTGATLGLISLINIEATKYGYDNPNIDYNFWFYIILFFMFIGEIAIIIHPIIKIIKYFLIVVIGIHIYDKYIKKKTKLER